MRMQSVDIITGRSTFRNTVCERMQRHGGPSGPMRGRSWRRAARRPLEVTRMAEDRASVPTTRAHDGPDAPRLRAGSSGVRLAVLSAITALVVVACGTGSPTTAPTTAPTDAAP